MERFLAPLLILALFFWTACVHIVFRIPPDSPFVVSYFLLSVFGSLALFFSLVGYLVRLKFAPGWQDRRTLFRKSLPPALIASLTLVAYFLLRLLRAATILNVSLLLAIALTVSVCRPRRRR